MKKKVISALLASTMIVSLVAVSYTHLSVIVGNEHGYFIEGKVVVGAFHPDTMENYIDKTDLVILGNRAEDQLCAIEMDASCISVGLGAKVTNCLLYTSSRPETG